MPETRPVVLLGPQQQSPSVAQALSSRIGPDLPVAVVSAGWEEREAEHIEFREHVGRPVANLALFQRAEDVFARDPELHAAAQRLNDRLRELQRLHQIRLRHAVPAAEELLRREGATEELIEPEIEAAFVSLRALDAHHRERVAALRTAFWEKHRPAEHAVIAEHRQQIAQDLAGAHALCIAGGHVGILYHRLWLFDVFDLVPATLPIFAWSAGAMVLAPSIVLFHDSPPEGQGHAEIWGPGFGLCDGIVPLPHAAARLELEDPVRVQLLARRFPESLCAALESGSELTFADGVWTAGGATMQLQATGEVGAL